MALLQWYLLPFTSLLDFVGGLSIHALARNKVGLIQGLQSHQHSNSLLLSTSIHDLMILKLLFCVRVSFCSPFICVYRIFAALNFNSAISGKFDVFLPLSLLLRTLNNSPELNCVHQSKERTRKGGKPVSQYYHHHHYLL